MVTILQNEILKSTLTKLITTEEEYNSKYQILLNLNIDYSKYLEVFKTYANISIYGDDYPETKEWDNVIPLQNLFFSEIYPENPDCFFDQRFINYLAQNENDLRVIHWRNFERLISEYFNKNDYEVELGQGSKDGGVDIKVWSDRKSRNGPPLIIIQCKRYEKTKIGIETIKAFYADIEFLRAGKGLIATTTYITKDGKDLIKARSYNIDCAEFDNVSNMIHKLKKIS